jgi:hypothetical protein
MTATNVTTPVGRLVMGSLYKERTTDAEGKPLTVKTGQNAGQPRVDYFFALAIPKGNEQHWAQTPWGAEIWKVGHAAFPHAAGAADFSWKVTDGDSAQPGKLFKGKPGKAPRENEGWPGHWILKFSGGFAPSLYKPRPGVPGQHDPFNEPDAIKLGYYVQVNFNVAGNGSQTSPGVYINHRMVCFAAFGPEISVGPDVASAGFGQSALPPGATLTPPANFNPGQPAAAAPGLPPAPGGVPPIPATPAAIAPPPAAPAPVAAAPSYALAPAYITSGHTVDSLAAAAGGHAQALAAGWIVQAAAPAPLPVTPPLPPATSAPVPGVPGAPTAVAGVAPNPAFVAIPGQPAAGMPPVPGAAPAPAPVPVPAARRVVMNPGQQPYETFKAAGWQDDAIVGQGYGQWAA